LALRKACLEINICEYWTRLVDLESNSRLYLDFI
jgi:hypothetical protein